MNQDHHSIATMIVALPLCLIFIPYISEAAVTKITAFPSNPSTVIETHDRTLIWTYTLDGAVLLARFSNVTGGGDDEIARKTVQDGRIRVKKNYQDRFSAGVTDTHAWLKILRVQRSDQGKYQFSVTATLSGTDTDVVEVIIYYEPSVTIQHCSTPVTEGENATLSCTATGFPVPNFKWIRASTRNVLSNNQLHIIRAIKRNESGSYECLASNGIGNSSTKSCTIDVQYQPNVILSAEYKVAVHQSVTLHCRAEGNPQPTFTWTPCNPQENVCHKSTLNIPDVLNDSVYTCTVTNYLGTDSVNTNVVIASTEINVTLVITSDSCIAGKWYQSLMLSKQLNEAIDLIFVNESAYRRTTVMDVRCGSFIVDLALKFSSTVTEKWVLTMLKEATKNGRLGEFSVNTSSIIRTRVLIQSTISPSNSKTTPSLSDVEDCRRCSCNCAILIAVLTIFAAIIILLIIYIIWPHKKGKTGRGRSCAESPGKRGNSNTAVEMEVRQSDQMPSKQQMSEVSSRTQYMALDDACRSNNFPEKVKTATDTSQTSQYTSLHPSTMSVEIPRENVTIEKIIGKGAFGQVAKGTVIGLCGRPQITRVAVKMLKDNAPESDRKDLLSELKVMKTLKPHPHVIKLLGCVTESEPLLMLIEYVPYGDLLGYLRKSRGLNDTYYNDPDSKPQTSLTSQQLMKFAWQIADGMSYLSLRSIIHRDLAARNVLVGESQTCKVTDFGMARDVQQENIYERKTKGRLPVKWTAYEALMYGTYTTKSDVWSYGILLYEIFTVGGSPYPRMDGRKIASLLQQGYRMPKPQHVDNDLYKIMTTCWEEDTDVRPTFAELRNKLKKMENQHKRLINMKMYDTQLYANVEDLVV